MLSDLQLGDVEAPIVTIPPPQKLTPATIHVLNKFKV